MSETTNLKLFKHDNPATNENQFDVTKALNNNWDKLDKFAGTTNTNINTLQEKDKEFEQDINDIQDKNTEQDDEIEALQKKNEELKAENERLRQDMNAYPSNEASGEYITLNDSADSRFNKFKILGKSTQATRSGKNKFNINMVSISTATDKVFTTSSFVVTDKWSQVLIYNENLIKMLEPNKNYKMIADVTLLEKTSDVSSGYNNANLLTLYDGTNTITVLKTSTTTEKNNWTINEKKHLITEFTTPADLTGYGMRCYCYYTNNAGAGKFKYDNVMILEATEEDETFEQYGVSPSPEFSSKTRNVGDNINHFNKSTIKTGYYLDNTGAEIANINYAITDYMKVEENENYVYQGLNIESSFASKGAYYNSNKEFVDYFDLNAKNTLMKIPENVKYVRFTLRILNNNQDTFKFEKGTIATPYSPYECGNIEFDICNNNLTNTDIVASLNHPAITINSKSSFSIDLAKGNIANLQSLDFFFGKNNKNKVYKLSYHLYQNNSSFRPYLFFRYSDGIFTVLPNNGSETEMDVTLTSTEGKTIEQISFGWGTQTGGGIATLSDIYLRQVDDTSEFQEQEKQEFVFPLLEGQVLREGDYLADDGIQNKRIQTSFNGTENWAFNSTYECVTINILVLGFQLGVDANIISNRFKAASKGKEGINYISSNSLYVKIDGLTTLEEYKAKFAEWEEEGEPFTIEGNALEMTVTAYTPEQQKVYNEIVNTAKTYKNVTNIFSTNEVSPVFEVNYRKDIETMINNVNKAVLSNA